MINHSDTHAATTRRVSLSCTMTKVNMNGSEVEAEDRDSVETLLRRFEQDDLIVLDNIECTPGSRLGDNYMSIVKRVRVTGTRNGNEG